MTAYGGMANYALKQDGAKSCLLALCGCTWPYGVLVKPALPRHCGRLPHLKPQALPPPPSPPATQLHHGRSAGLNPAVLGPQGVM